jgi:hypothetical protein
LASDSSPAGDPWPTLPTVGGGTSWSIVATSSADLQFHGHPRPTVQMEGLSWPESLDYTVGSRVLTPLRAPLAYRAQFKLGDQSSMGGQPPLSSTLPTAATPTSVGDTGLLIMEGSTGHPMDDQQRLAPTNAVLGSEQESRQFHASLLDGEWALLLQPRSPLTSSREVCEDPMCREAIVMSQPPEFF